MGDELKAGRLADLDGSLAKYLEDAFDDVRAEFGLDPLPAEGRHDRLMLFLGISRGIVTYLNDFAPAFVVRRHDSMRPPGHDTDTDGYVDIQADVS